MKNTSKQTAKIPADLKFTNRKKIMSYFKYGGPYTINDIADQIHLSRQTVQKAFQFFVDKGMLISNGKGNSTNAGGKRPELFSLSQNKYMLCMTMWPDIFKLNLFNLKSELIGTMECHWHLPDDPKAAVDVVGKMAVNMLKNYDVQDDALCGVSLSTSGTVDYTTNSLKYSAQSPKWGTDIPIGAFVKTYFPKNLLTIVENAGKMTARPLLKQEELQDKRILVLFTTWGLSSCMIDRGTILNGKNSLIGEVGHMVLDPGDTERCGCGSYGCAERLVSIQRIQAMIIAQKDRYPDSCLFCKPIASITVQDVFEASSNNDPLAKDTVRYIARVFAYLIRNVSVVFDPELVVFQGDYSFADKNFDEVLWEYLREFQYFDTDPFKTYYDKRSLTVMDAWGSYAALVDSYFDNEMMYSD